MKLWKIKDSILRGEEKDQYKALMALIIMMDIGIIDKQFREYADQNPDFYKWFE